MNEKTSEFRRFVNSDENGRLRHRNSVCRKLKAFGSKFILDKGIVTMVTEFSIRLHSLVQFLSFFQNFALVFHYKVLVLAFLLA